MVLVVVWWERGVAGGGGEEVGRIMPPVAASDVSGRSIRPEPRVQWNQSQLFQACSPFRGLFDDFVSNLRAVQRNGHQACVKTRMPCWLNLFNAELVPTKRYWRGPRSQEALDEEGGIWLTCGCTEKHRVSILDNRP